MSEWITDRYPQAKECCIYNAQGQVVPYNERKSGEPWKPIPRCEPYVKPKRLRVRYKAVEGHWVIEGLTLLAMPLYVLYRDDDAHREAAERIAAIYEEVMP